MGVPACYVAWAGAAASSHALDIPAALGRCLGLADGIMVSLRALPDVPMATDVSVEPANVDDWEQVELNAEYMEEQLLNQVLDAHPHHFTPHHTTLSPVLLCSPLSMPAMYTPSMHHC